MLFDLIALAAGCLIGRHFSRRDRDYYLWDRNNELERENAHLRRKVEELLNKAERATVVEDELARRRRLR